MDWMIGLILFVVVIYGYDSMVWLYRYLTNSKRKKNGNELPFDKKESNPIPSETTVINERYQNERNELAIRFLYAVHGAKWVHSLNDKDFENEVMEAVKILDSQK